MHHASFDRGRDKGIIRVIWDMVFDISALEWEREELIDELNVVAALIQDGIRQYAHVAKQAWP